VAAKRLNREQFYDKLAEMDEAALKKALWTLYWRGSASVRERIESEIDPQVRDVRQAAPQARPAPGVVLREVTEFATLARAGAYLGRDRRVSPKARTRWRHTFRGHATQALDALGGEEVESAARAVATLIDLACETMAYDYFRSEDAVEAARFVVSDAAALLWSTIQQKHGFVAFSERAASELIRWESPYGWTRRGDGWVSQRETSLADVVAKMLRAADAWGQFADQYLRALDDAAEGGRSTRAGGVTSRDRTGALSEWHALLLERLAGGEYEDRLDVLVEHRALAGPERTFLQARLMERRGDRDRARGLVRECLTALPGHRQFLAFAGEIGA